MKVSASGKPNHRYYKKDLREFFGSYCTSHLCQNRSVNFPLDRKTGQTKRLAFISVLCFICKEANKLNSIKCCKSDIT